jgi:hypothetical protein
MAALSRQPEGRVLGLHQVPDAGQQDITDRPLVLRLAQRPGQRVHLAQGPVLALELGVRPVAEDEGGEKHGEQQHRPRTLHINEQHDEAETRVHGPDGKHR